MSVTRYNLQPRALSFDLDDTLWPCADVIDRAESALFAWLQRQAPAITAQHSRADLAAQRQRLAAARPDLAANLTRLRHESLRRNAIEAGYPEKLADHAVEVFLDERNRVDLYTDVVPALVELRRRYPLIALTNGNACVERVGLGDYFDAAVSAADVGAAKPHPAMFERACRELALHPRELLHVGDDPVRDVHAARNWGARAVWLNRAGADWPDGLQRADAEMPHLEPLSALLVRER